MSASRVRIFSDLHFGDAHSSLQSLAEFVPLIGDATEVVLNGDTLNAQFTADTPHLSSQEVRIFFEQEGSKVTLLRGNHDPDISALAELQLCDERVWITHGDVFFDLIAPWSCHRAELARRLSELGAGLSPGETAQIETRLRLHRLACLDLPRGPKPCEQSAGAYVRSVLRTLFPPTRLVEILKAWQRTPSLVGRMARSQRPKAQVVVLGHTHYPGVWHLRGPRPLTVINTGSFSHSFGKQFVELHGDRVRVVRIDKTRGRFHPGRTVADFALQPTRS